MFTRRLSSPSSINEVGVHIRPDTGNPKQKRGSLTYLNSLALVVSLQIGSGVFFAPSEISKHVLSPGAGVLVWLLAGLIVWTGAASFIELGRAIPENGGAQEYLRCCFGDFYGFLTSWVWISICKPCAMAIIATTFATHLSSAFLPASLNSTSVDKIIAITGMVVLTVINCMGAKTGALAANGFFVMKLLALLSIVMIGMSVGLKGQGDGVGKGNESSWFSNGNYQTESNTAAVERQNIWLVLGDFVTAIFAALFCYGGWETVSHLMPS
jgi:solute carrier family 7 (L-type amino acid transporter), member 6